MSNYKQCDLVKDIKNGGSYIDISWVSSEYAVIGKYIKLKNEDGTWDNGWRVQAVYETSRTIEEIRALQSEDRSYKNSSIGQDGWDTHA